MPRTLDTLKDLQSRVYSNSNGELFFDHKNVEPKELVFIVFNKAIESREAEFQLMDTDDPCNGCEEYGISCRGWCGNKNKWENRE